jgi:2-succinyl-6-hydroxy-2,4-cyclohexadiene-1-carboxylate synthase
VSAPAQAATSGAALPFERRGRGPALVLLHGFTGSAAAMAGVARAFEDDFETIAPDLPGHGRSAARPPAADTGFDDTVARLVATLDAAGHRRAHWLGYSMGARLALGVAVRHPARVASLVLLGGRAGIEDPLERAARREADEALAGRIETIGVEAFVDEWLAQPLFATLARLGPAFVAAQREARLANDARGLAASLRALGPGAQPPLFDALAGLRLPVLLVAGALDARFVASARELARRLPDAEPCVIADAGHAAHLEQPAVFHRAVAAFLRRAAGATHPVSPHPVQETAQ